MAFASVAAVLLALAVAPAWAAGEAAACFQSKMGASRIGSGAWLRCGAKGDPSTSSRVAACITKGDAGVRDLLLTADAAATAAQFLCPGSAESLGLSGPLPWPLRILADVDAGPSPVACRRRRAGALRRLATDYGHCVEGREAAAVDFTACEQAARAAFRKLWVASFKVCETVDPDTSADSVEAEVEETASRLRVACGDGRIGGFEECDDGGTTDGDGCSADCRTESCTTLDEQTTCSLCPGGCGPETCARVDGEMRCIACPADAVPDPTYRSCRCAGGYSGQPGTCADIDECAAPVDPCSSFGPCVNLPGRYACAIACNADAFHAALASCGAPSGAIAFDCSNAVIALPGSASPALRDNFCDNLVIDGAGRNITFESAPQCWQAPLDPALCPGGSEPDGSCFCPNVDSGDAFLTLRGNGNIVRDLTVRGFFEGVHTRGRNNLVENMDLDRMCDDAFGNGPGGVGNTFAHVTVRRGCDKCSENTGTIADTDADPRVTGHFNAVLKDIDFDTCLTPVRISSSGRYLLDRVNMAGGTAEFPCDGPRFSSTGVPGELVVTIRNSRVTDCRRGLRVGTNSHAVLQRTAIRGSGLRGVRAASTARVSIEDSTIERNGGEGSTEDGFGGVAAMDGAALDLGGGSIEIDGALRTSAGGNSLCGNLDAAGLPQDLFNGVTNAAVSATANWWCSVDPATNRIAGAAQVLPVLTRAPDAYIPGP